MNLRQLIQRLEECTGGDREVDAAVALAFGVPDDHYTGSVEACRDLVTRVLPGWKLHLGFDVTGVFPYAALTLGAVHLEAEAAALPLAILKVVVKAANRLPETPGPAPSPAP